MNVLDEYDKGEPDRNERRLTIRWKADGRNVMTDDGPDEKALHIATFASPTVAAHIVELHNRTLGDGQAPPLRMSDLLPGPAGCAPGCDYPVTGRHASRGGRQLCQTEANRSRPYLPDDLQLARHFGPPGTARVEVDIRGALERLLAELVQRRVAEYLERHQPSIRIELPYEPVTMANILVKLGWKVEPPEEPVTTWTCGAEGLGHQHLAKADADLCRRLRAQAEREDPS